jgi:pimeloyl-ACP methyl ester carboxylesterase
LAWGDPDRLSDSDVLRFQWPSIGEGWEGGLINFSRSRILSSAHSPNSPDDGRLFREVASRADTRVVIVYGSKDRVVRIDDGAAEALRGEFPNVRVIKMEGLGHDPFEEDVPGFLTALEGALEG